MAIKLNEQIIIIILLIAVLALFAVSFNLYSTARELIRSEQDIASKMESISSGINTLSQRLQEANSWVGNQRSELDKAVNEPERIDEHFP